MWTGVTWYGTFTEWISVIPNICHGRDMFCEITQFLALWVSLVLLFKWWRRTYGKLHRNCATIGHSGPGPPTKSAIPGMLGCSLKKATQNGTNPTKQIARKTMLGTFLYAVSLFETLEKDMTRMKSCAFLFDDVENCLVDPLKDRRAGCPAGLISIGHLVLLLEHTKVVQVAPSCTKLHLSRPWNSWTWRNYVVTFLAQIHVLDSPVRFFEGCPLWQGILSIKPIVLHCPPVKIKRICFWMELQSSFWEPCL